MGLVQDHTASQNFTLPCLPSSQSTTGKSHNDLWGVTGVPVPTPTISLHPHTHSHAHVHTTDTVTIQSFFLVMFNIFFPTSMVWLRELLLLKEFLLSEMPFPLFG